jgi:hypothetical protein
LISGNWQNTYSTVSTNSANWNNNYNILTANSGNWNSTYTTLCGNSASWAANPQVMEATVYNANGVTLTRGQVVYSFGATGSTMSVKLASNSGESTSSKALGFVNETIAPGGIGTVTIAGRMENLNFPLPYVDGDALWLGSTPGSYTRTKPIAPNHGVYLGVVERANSGNGIAYIKVQNGYELNEIHDTLITSPLSGQILRRNNENTLWINTDDGDKWNSTYTTLNSNSGSWNNNLPLSGGTLTGNLTGTNIFGNLASKINYYNGNTTLSLQDAGAILKIDTSSSAVTITIDTEAVIGWVPGTQIIFLQWYANPVSFAIASGVTLNSYSNYTNTNGQYAMASLIYMGSDVWLLGGNLI